MHHLKRIVPEEPVPSGKIKKTGPYKVHKDIYDYVNKCSSHYDTIEINSSLRYVIFTKNGASCFIDFDTIVY